MRISSLFYPAFVFCLGMTGAFSLLASRYAGTAQKSITLCLALTTAASVAAALGLGALGVRAKDWQKLTCFLALSYLTATASLLKIVGIDGLLPAVDGTQAVGVEVLLDNLDLFTLVILTSAVALRRAFRFQSL